jgi:photosystem II stability/assembly factor-like uncharacterized protein
MLQSFSGPVPRAAALVLLALAAAAAPTYAQAPSHSAAPAYTAVPDSSKHTPMNSVSEITKHIEAMKAARATRNRGKDSATAEREREEHAPRKGAKASKLGTARDVSHEELDWLEARKFYLKQRAFPNDTVDWQAIKNGSQMRDRLPSARLRPVSSTPGNGSGSGPGGPKTNSVTTMAVQSPSSKWEFIGPRNLAVPYRTYYGQGVTCGRVNAMAYSPDGSIYAAGASGGVWKSAGGGYQWKSLSDTWPALGVSSIAIDPKNSNIIYVGTGDFQGLVGGIEFGIMKSTDGGNTWTNYGKSQFGTVAVSQVVIDPDNTSIITIATGNGADRVGYVWRSTDGGATWTKAFDSANAWSALTVSKAGANGKRTYYAAGIGAIQRSTDQGATWTPVSLPSGGSLPSYPAMATSKANADTVYLLSPGDQAIFKSTDAGTSWSDVTGGFPGGYNWSQYFYDYHINTSTLVDRFNRLQDAVYVGLIDIVQSPDGGNRWRSVGLTYTSGALTHNDQHSMAVNPKDPNDMFIGNDGGIYRLTYNGRRDAFSFNTASNQTLGITQFYHAAFHPYDASKMIGGTQDNATPLASGDLSNWGNVGGGDGGFSEIHPLSPSEQYATSYFGQIYRTTDSWNTYDYFGLPDSADFVWPIALDPQDQTLLYGGGTTVWKYRFSGKFGYSLQPLAPVLSQFGLIEFIAVAPSDSKRIYAGSSAGELFMTTNGGGSWSEIDQGATSLPTRFITCIAVSPDDPSRIVVTVSGTGSSHVWRCPDTTAASPLWVDASAGLPDAPTNTVCLDPTDPANTYYVGTDVGVFLTQDGGASYTNMTLPLGMPNVQVNELRHVYGTGYLNAATYGRGMWRIKIANPVAPVSRLSTIPVSPHGGQPVTLVISTIAPAPLGGQKVTLQSSNPAVVSVPSSATVVAGFNILQLKVSTGRVSAKTQVTLTANGGGKSRTLKVTVVP